MFRNDETGPDGVVRRGLALARDLGHPRVGSEHLLLALIADGGPVAGVLARHGVTATAVRAAACAAAPGGAGAAADRSVLAAIGVDLDRVLANRGLTGGAAGALERPVGRRPVFPLGGAAARRRAARLKPPLGSDVRAAYEASLRLALARRERQHRPEHLALALVALDPGIGWVLAAAGVPAPALLAGLAAAFPPPRRNALLRAERHLGRRSRHQDIVRRYQRQTGRTAAAGLAVAALITDR
jgi:hypothetical protein